MLLQKYNDYLAEKSPVWSPTTLASERARVIRYFPHIDSPLSLFTNTSHLKPYSRKTLFIRVSQFMDWAVAAGHRGDNPYPKFMRSNFRAFQYAYTRTPLKLSFSDVLSRVERVSDPSLREAAQDLLRSGLRFHELAGGATQSGMVRGKGGKLRPVKIMTDRAGVSYQRLYGALKKVGLKPHDLRKAALSRLVDMKASPAELMEIAGWSNLNTAQSYIAARASRVDSLLTRMADLTTQEVPV